MIGYLARILLAATFACTSFAAVAAEKIEGFALALPDRLGNFQKVGRNEFPQKALGVNVPYETAAKVRASVFVYNGGLSSIPPGIDAPIVRKHFAQVLSEVKSLERSGTVRAVTFTDIEKNTAFPGCGVQFLWREYDLNLEGNVLKSATYLAAVDNHFIKIRTTYREGAPEGRAQIEKFVADFSRFLARCA